MVIGCILAVSLCTLPAVAQDVGTVKYGDVYFVPYADPTTKQDLSFVISDDAAATVIRVGSLMWACTGSQFSIVFEPDVPLFTEEREATVEWRFGSNEIHRGRWSFGPDRLTLIAPEYVVQGFLEESAHSQHVELHILGEFATDYSYEFSLVGFVPASARLACLPFSPSNLIHRQKVNRAQPMLGRAQSRCAP